MVVFQIGIWLRSFWNCIVWRGKFKLIGVCILNAIGWEQMVAVQMDDLLLDLYGMERLG